MHENGRRQAAVRRGRMVLRPGGNVNSARVRCPHAGKSPRIVVDRRGRLLGAAIVGADAGELIAECVLAIGKDMTVADLSAAIHAYPTRSQITRCVADEACHERSAPPSRVWKRRLFGLRGT